MTSTHTKTPYVYKWTHLPTMRWYVGSRTSKRAYPDEPIGKYRTSSRVVSELIKHNPEEWHKTIVATGTAAEMIELESEILQTVDAAKDPRSFNCHNNCGRQGRYFSACAHLQPEHIERARRLGLSNRGKRLTAQQLLDRAENPLTKGWQLPLNNRGSDNPRYLGKIIGTDITTGETITFIGSDALNAAGYRHGHVYACINGRKPQYKGYRWYRV
jgi:hypothetical protein